MTDKLRWILSGLTLGLLLSFSGLDTVRAADSTWTARYWNNKTLSGEPVLTRQENTIAYDWGEDKPASEVNRDGFSARWTRRVSFATTGTYRFSATSDDGMRVWVAGDLIIDLWDDHPPQTETADVYLTATDHDVNVEYYDAVGGEVVHVSWAAVGFGNWQGAYFNNKTLSGTPALVRNDGDLNFEWGEGRPASGVNTDGFSVRWTRTARFEAAATYRFTVTSDDGMRVWVDDRLIIDEWYDHSSLTKTGDAQLSAGNYDIEVEYYDSVGTAIARLSWARVGSSTTPTQPTPTTTPSQTGTYTVRPGDFLAKIASMHGTTTATLISLNGPAYPSLYTNPSRIYAGWVLKVPISGGSGNGNTGGGGTYTVQRGDYLALISNKTGVSVNDLIRLNATRYPSMRTNPNVIYTGWVLRLL